MPRDVGEDHARPCQGTRAFVDNAVRLSSLIRINNEARGYNPRASFASAQFVRADEIGSTIHVESKLRMYLKTEINGDFVAGFYLAARPKSG